MDSDIWIRTAGKAGRITLQRPDALNALTHPMCLEIESALERWRNDASINAVVIDAEGDRAFCAGGDISAMYSFGVAGDFEAARQYWRDEYRLNAKIAEWPKPVVSLLQGFTMGGGVGIGCLGSHRIVCESSKVAMPECGIGLVPDAGGSRLLANAPGSTGEYLGLTGTRMGATDAIFSGFADYFFPRETWPDLVTEIEATGNPEFMSLEAQKLPAGSFSVEMSRINAVFALDTLVQILAELERGTSSFDQDCLKRMQRNSPLSMCCSLVLIRGQRSSKNIREILDREFRYTYRSLEFGDFLEGIRAQIIDRDNAPKWQHAHVQEVSPSEVRAMLAPLESNGLDWESAT